ncbi:uncharacterized protein LOC121699809 [Alosa sapidissima]|uniref:uncharacterized protein LOC121699809 n=1 Tax=Alosa sapidissima TaxID=34773 RepID=UPI001C085F06|nr:uncharacterized protein LOC121699809 [Alosa sapidissima]
MTDAQLTTYLPSYGDRLAVLGYCRRKGNCPVARKSKLFERLKAKILRSGDREHLSEKVPSRNAQKSERKIEMGWLIFRKEQFFQVRAKKGGGTRKICVFKDCRKDELIEKAINLFFPDQKNSEGNVTDFHIDLTDFQEHPLDNQTTVGELYEKTKLPILRFYLTTKKKASCRDNSGRLTQEGEDMQNTASSNPPRPSTLLAEGEETNPSDVMYVRSSNVLSDTNSDRVPLDYSTIDMSDLPSVSELDAAIAVDVLEDSGTVTFFQGHLHDVDSVDVDDTLQISPQVISSPIPILDITLVPIIQSERMKKILVVHRGQILRELISHFCDESIMLDDVYIQVVLPNGRLEKAVDEGGVLRDVLTEFWQDFYEQCTLGNAFKVPFLRHDFGRQPWESIGRIIVLGWRKEKYLPIKMAPIVLEQAALGCVKSGLVDIFLRYVTESERMVLDSCRSDFESVDQEELLEIMDLHSCRRVPTADNIEQLLEELAHQKLIQEPAFVIEQWSNVMAPFRSELEGISVAYENLHPTLRKVMRSLSYPTTVNNQQKQIGKYLGTYLRESDTQHLSLFLRFCTGSDLFLGKSISVTFTQLQGLQRRPIAHTCDCYLELPIEYDNYPDFRYEFNKVLESGMWEMDIV